MENTRSKLKYALCIGDLSVNLPGGLKNWECEFCRHLLSKATYVYHDKSHNLQTWKTYNLSLPPRTHGNLYSVGGSGGKVCISNPGLKRDEDL